MGNGQFNTCIPQKEYKEDGSLNQSAEKLPDEKRLMLK